MTDKETEALRLALEALESCWEVGLTDNNWKLVETGITAIREALAEQTAQQETVAILNHAHGVHAIRSVKLNGLPDGEYNLYTSSPASKPWVGLTDEDIGAACGFAEHTTASTRFALKAISRAIEAKLREKNA